MARLEVPYSGFNDPGSVREYPSRPQSPHVSPDAFGAQVGKALQGLGGDMQETANKYVALNNEIAATNLFTGSMQKMNDVWSEFSQLRGNDATSRLPEFQKRLEDAHNEVVSAAPNLAVKARLMDASKRYSVYLYRDLGNHAAQQGMAAVTKTTADAEDAFANNAVRSSNPGYEDRFDTMVDSVAGQRQKQAAILGLTKQGEEGAPSPWEGHIAAGVGKTIHDAVAYQLEVGNLDQANKIFDKYRDRMDARSVVAVGKLLHPANLKDQIDGFADELMPWTAEGYQAGQQAGKALGAQTGKGTVPVAAEVAKAASDHGINPSALSAFDRIESGGRSNAQTGSHKGRLQLQDEEFAIYGSGSIWNSTDNLNAGAAKLAAEAKSFTTQYGRPPNAIDLYMIHQQGAGGYAAHMANPDALAWENMASTGEGQGKGAPWAKQAIWNNIPDDMKAPFGTADNPTISSREFVEVWRQKLAHFGAQPDAPVLAVGEQGAQPATATHPTLQQSLQRAFQHPEIRNNTDLRHGVEAEIHRRYRDFEAGAAQKHAEISGRLDQLYARAAAGETGLSLDKVGLSEEGIRQVLPPYEADQRIERVRAVMQFADQVDGLRYASPQQMEQFTSGIRSGEGLKFPHHKDTEEIIAGAASQFVKNRQAKLDSDPAGYALGAPEVQRLFKVASDVDATGVKLAQSNPAMKNKVFADTLNAWSSYATAQLAAQEYMGVPAEQRHILVAKQAESIVARIQGGDNPKQALNELQRNAGQHWPQYYKDLVQLGNLPADAQALQMIPDRDANDLSWFMGQYSGKAKTPEGQSETVEQRVAKLLPNVAGGKSPVVTAQHLIRDNHDMNAMIMSWRSTAQFLPGTETEMWINNMQGAVDKLAYTRMLIYGEAPAIAADHAIHAFTDQWSFSRDGAMVPHGRFDHIDAASASLKDMPLDQITPAPQIGGVKTPYGFVGGLTPEQYWEAVKASPRWITNASHDGLLLTDGNIVGGSGGLVRRRDGSPIEWKFTQTPKERPAYFPTWTY